MLRVRVLLIPPLSSPQFIFANVNTNFLTRGAALSASCTVRVEFGQAYYDLRQNAILGEQIDWTHEAADAPYLSRR